MTRTPLARITPGALRWAREDAWLTEAETAALAGVDVIRLRQWEDGEALPTIAQLRSLADAFRRPVAFFFAPGVPASYAEQPPDFRASKGALSRQLRREVRAATERRRFYAELTSMPADSPWRRWRNDPPATPEEARARLGVPLALIEGAPNAAAALHIWIDAVEAQGVLVFQMSSIAVNECRGFAQDDESAPVIVLNGADAPQARSFTLLHEFAHLLDRSGALCLLDDEREVERRCNRFAAAVLMPSDATRDAVANEDERQRVGAAVRRFRVSPVAAALHLRALGLVSQAVVNATIREAASAARRAGEQERRGGPAHHVLKRRNLGDRYLGTVLDALARDAITFADATYYLESNAATVDRMERSLAGSRV